MAWHAGQVVGMGDNDGPSRQQQVGSRRKGDLQVPKLRLPRASVRQGTCHAARSTVRAVYSGRPSLAGNPIQSSATERATAPGLAARHCAVARTAPRGGIRFWRGVPLHALHGTRRQQPKTARLASSAIMPTYGDARVTGGLRVGLHPPRQSWSSFSSSLRREQRSRSAPVSKRGSVLSPSREGSWHIHGSCQHGFA